MQDRISQVHAVLVAGWKWVGATVWGSADWSRGSGCFFSGRQRCVQRPWLRSRKQEEGHWGEMSDKCQIYKLERQALTKAQCLEGWKNARHSPCFSPPTPPPNPLCFLVNPLFPPFCCFPLSLHAVYPFLPPFAEPRPGSHFWLSLSVGRLVFFPLFSLHSFLRGLSGAVNSSGCQISLHCLLVGDILSSLRRSQPTGLFGQVLDPLTWPAVYLEFWGFLWLKNVWPASNSLFRSLSLLQTGLLFAPGPEPKPDRQEAFKVRETSRKACCCVHARSEDRLVSIAPQGGTHSHTCWSLHSSHVSFMW